VDAGLLRGRICGGGDSVVANGVRKRPNLLAGEHLPRGPQQKRSLEKRARLKEAALALFGEKGYEGTSIGGVARRARLPVGSFYQHYRSKRQLLLVLMDDLLESLSRMELRPAAQLDVRGALGKMLSGAFSADLRSLGACRAWQEASLADTQLARKEVEIHSWTTARVKRVFEYLQRLPGARRGVDVPGLARVMDNFFWSLLGQGLRMSKVELKEWLASSTHLIYHAMFEDAAK
jgi:AcrR family transcriptional regulator